MAACRIANGAGFLGDDLAAPRRLLERAEVDFLTLEYLAELTMSVLAAQRRQNSQLGYAGDFLRVLGDMAPLLLEQPALRVVTNAGGVNVLAGVHAAARALVAAGLGDCRVAAVTGDDLLPRLAEFSQKGWEFPHFDTGEPLPPEIRPSVVAANAYLGAAGVVTALQGEARIVISGRVADASLTLGPAMHAWGWNGNELDRLAGGTVAGHVIECGAQATGGYSVRWSGQALADVGYPIAEVEANGSCVITKPANSGGIVDRLSVSEQLVYEIGDPRCYRTPDVNVDFTSLTLADEGPDRVRIGGARGAPPPKELKVSLAHAVGFTAAGTLLVFGRGCLARARQCASMVRSRLQAAGCEPAHWHEELLGTGDGVPHSRGVSHQEWEPPELVLRMAVEDPRREAVERFTREMAPLITSGPAGLAGYAAGRPTVRPVFAYWPSTVPRELVAPACEIRTARQWGENTS